MHSAFGLGPSSAAGAGLEVGFAEEIYLLRVTHAKASPTSDADSVV